MTDIVKKMRSQIGDDVRRVFDHEALFKEAADRITALEAELAEVRRERDEQYWAQSSFWYALSDALCYLEDGPDFGLDTPEKQIEMAISRIKTAPTEPPEILAAALRSQRAEVLREAAAIAAEEGWPDIMSQQHLDALTGEEEAAMNCATRIEQAILALIPKPATEKPE